MFKLIAKNHVKHWPAKAQFAVNDGAVQSVDFHLDLVLIPTNEFNKLARVMKMATHSNSTKQT